MVKFKVNVNPHGQIYLAQEIRAELNTRHLEILGNSRAIIIFPEGIDLTDVLGSLEIIKSDIQHRLELKRKENNNNGGKG